MSRTPQNSLARSSAVMFAGTLTSRILGFVRNALLAVALGATASGAADAFNTANALPTQLYNLLIGGILNAVLVPQIVRALRQKNGDELVNRLLTAAGTLILAVTVLLTIAAPLVHAPDLLLRPVRPVGAGAQRPLQLRAVHVVPGPEQHYLHRLPAGLHADLPVLPGQ